MDDFVEEQKLNSGRGSSERVSFPWQPEVWAVSGEEEGRDEGGGGETQAQLKEMLKTEREQKVRVLASLSGRSLWGGGGGRDIAVY